MVKKTPKPSSLCKCLAPLSSKEIKGQVEWRLQAVGIGPGRTYLIGSRAAGKCNILSDIDVLVKYPKGTNVGAQQAQLDEIVEEEYLEGEIEEGPQEIDIHLATYEPRQPLIPIASIDKIKKTCGSKR